LSRSFLIIVLALLTFSAGSRAESPRLVLQITIDGLRADLIERYSKDFGKGGFHRLINNGIVYRNAHYLHANTETIVGHTTLATGATPAVHGMVGNVWYHADSGGLGYNIEDAQAPLLPTREHAAEGAQVDPAQKRARSNGRSPRGILAPTFSDTLKISSGGQAKIFGVSGKDRSAVAMAGQAGTAYWYSTNTGDFQSSRYYMEAYPEWVEGWNKRRGAETLSDTQWTLQDEHDTYLFADQDDRPYEVDLKGYGRIFPHAYGNVGHPLFFTRVLVSPAGDRLLLDFTKTLIESEGIGNDSVTDYLSVSFSSVDAVNHFFGPGSLESEETVRQLDRTLEDLLKFIERKVGLDNTLIVLSADHGIAEMPEYASELGYGAGRIYGDEVLALSREISSELFGDETLVKDFFRPYLYLDASALARKGLKSKAVASAIAIELAKSPAIGGAISSRDETVGTLKGVEAAVRHNYHPTRSGDIYVFQKPYWFMFDRGAVAAMHGSPWSYDNHVPIIFSGMNIKAAKVDRLVHPVDVAPTLSAVLGISPPAAATGDVLAEVLGK
jgi:predicted AlkP superfamily pyrophosphatase or phosphodiesterase